MIRIADTFLCHLDSPQSIPFLYVGECSVDHQDVLAGDLSTPRNSARNKSQRLKLLYHFISHCTRGLVFQAKLTLVLIRIRQVAVGLLDEVLIQCDVLHSHCQG